ncbi:MAG: hypothetical protein LBQ94_12510 [Treponema sp.]|jgi:hypothetical protein|nr:hypothetical protein [Treponema sp.]
MNRKMKEGLRTAFDTPPPKRKSEFLLSLNFPKINRFDFILAQIGYIRKRVWIITMLSSALALLVPRLQAGENALNVIWIVSSFLPFIALAGITEIARGVSYNMAELEMSCKHTFSDIVLARLGILACANMIVFAAVMASLRLVINVEIPRLGIYLFTPFLLTCALSLFALNRLRSREGIYICGGISCFVSIFNALLSSEYSRAFSGEYMVFWGAAFFILLLWTAGEIIKLIRRTEEYQWNLSLTA